jgi:uncharacterized protein YndB with AHSA1/START domain
MKLDVKRSSDRLEITRVFAAPRARFFRWWTTGDRLQQWSSCKEATRCEVQADFRVGGEFVQTMEVHGKEFTVRGLYEEIAEPERIVYRADFGFAMTRVRLEFFEDSPSSTRLVLTHEDCPSEFFMDNVSHGTLESFEKLDESLAAEPVSVPA